MVLLITLLLVGLFGFYQARKPLADGLDYRSPVRALAPEEVRFLSDVTATTADGEPWVRQEIFAEIFQQIRSADGFVVADFFLINEFAGGEPDEEKGVSLSQRFVDALVAARDRNPQMPIILISDRLNTLYGGVEQPLFDILRANGIEVVLADLRQLRDSNLIFSPVWRIFLQWWGEPKGSLVPNPIGEGRVGLAALLELLNFKANHRKALVTATQDGRLRGLVTSANPHSASALHGNVAVSFEGSLAADLIRSEEAVYRMTTGEGFPEAVDRYLKNAYEDEEVDDRSLSGVVLTEKAIKRELLDRIEQLERGDRADLALFYFSDMDLRDSLARAVDRGAWVRLLLDPNKDAFGRQKNGIPNRQVAGWLSDRGVEVRWYRTSGEQFHSKMAFFQFRDGQSSLVLGSANWTRRNLDNFNLETSVSVTGPKESPVFVDAGQYFSLVWTGGSMRSSGEVAGSLVTSVPFAEFRDPSTLRKVLYWIMERTGASTF